MATNVNANKTFYSRFQLKYDTYENWVSANPVLLAGEMAIATIAAIEGATSLDHNSVPLPQVLIKIGDGTTDYKTLPFISAKAADVYEWAKAATKPSYEAKEISGVKEYRITKTANDRGDCYRLQERAAGSDDTAWIDVSYVADEALGIMSTVDIPDLTSELIDLSKKLGSLPILETPYADFAAWITAVEAKADANATAISDHEKYVGEFTHDTATTVIEYIDAKVSEVAGDADTNLEELQKQVNALEDEVGNPAADGEPSTGLYEIIDGIERSVSAHETAITETIPNTYATKEQLTAEQERAEGAEKALSDRIGAPSSDDADASGVYIAIEAEVTRATEAEGILAQNIEDLTEAVGNLSNIMNFRGAFTATTEVTEPKAGDVIVIKASETTDENGQPVNAAIVGKEYVYDGTEWVELGDTTAEQARLSAIEERVTETEQAIGQPANGETAGIGLHGKIEAETARATSAEEALAERVSELEEATTDIADLVQEKGYIVFCAGSASEVI